jgi:hypothetical protein
MYGDRTMAGVRGEAASPGLRPESRSGGEKMFDGIGTAQAIAMLSPLIALQLGLAIFCAVKILREGTKNLNKAVWLLIAVFVNLIGPIAFLFFGRKKDR